MKSRDLTQSMWASALAMLEQADRMHRQCFHLSIAQTRRPVWEPPVDMFESEHELSILIALPGVAQDSVRVVIDGGELYVVGERPLPALPGAQVRRMEIPYGSFERYIDLPPGMFEIVRRDLTNGCLLLGLRKLG